GGQRGEWLQWEGIVSVCGASRYGCHSHFSQYPSGENGARPSDQDRGVGWYDVWDVGNRTALGSGCDQSRRGTDRRGSLDAEAQTVDRRQPGECDSSVGPSELAPQGEAPRPDQRVGRWVLRHEPRPTV